MLYLDLKQQGNMMRLINDSQARAHAWHMRVHGTSMLHARYTHGARMLYAWLIHDLQKVPQPARSSCASPYD